MSSLATCQPARKPREAVKHSSCRGKHSSRGQQRPAEVKLARPAGGRPAAGQCCLTGIQLSRWSKLHEELRDHPRKLARQALSDSGSQPSASCTTGYGSLHHAPAFNAPASLLLAHASPLINHDANRQAANMCNEYFMGRRIIVNNALAFASLLPTIIRSRLVKPSAFLSSRVLSMVRPTPNL